MEADRKRGASKFCRKTNDFLSARHLWTCLVTGRILIRRLVIFGSLCCLFFLLIPAHTLQGQVDPRFGIIETYESPADALQAGAGWTRVRFQWAEVQAEGPYSWTPGVTDEQINGEVEAGRLVVGMLIGIPDWARDDNNLPQGLWLSHTDPENTWARFVRTAVNRYQDRINHWIIWNEPDIWDVDAPGHTWDGTEEDFLQLQRTAYLVARETNPDAVIHLAAMTYFWDAQFGREQYLNRFFQVLAADPEAKAHNYYFDVLTAHLYFQPNLIYDVIREFDRIREDNGIPEKPIWLVETNAPPINDPAWPVENWTLSVLIDEQAAFMPQAMASALAAGAEQVAIYKLKDTEDDRQANPEPFGLIRMSGSRRPAFTTYRVAVQYLSGFTGASRERWDEVGQIRVTQPGRITTVFFSRLPAEQQARIEAASDTAVLVTMWGEETEITAVDGYFTIDLPPALCTQPIGDYCMIGGSTFYLVQSANGGGPDPSVPTKTQMPTPTATPPLTPTPAPTVTPAETAVQTLLQTPTSPPTSTFPPTPLPAVSSSSTPTLGAEPSNPGWGTLDPLLLSAVVILFLVVIALYTVILRQRR